MRFLTRQTDPHPNPMGLDPDTTWVAPGCSLWGWGEAARIRPGLGEDRLGLVRRDFNSLVSDSEIDDRVGLPGSGPVCFVSTTFASGSPGSVAIIPRVLLGRRGETWWLTSVDASPLPERGDRTVPESARARYAGSSVPDVRWLEAVAEGRRRIESGDLEKLVLARDYAVWSREPFHPRRLIDHLTSRFPACHVFRITDLIGASPELLARRTGRAFESLALAGSAPAFADADADAAAAKALLASEKDRWEHELAVRSVTEPLGPLGLEVSFERTPHVLRLDNVQHLATRVTGEAPDHLDALSLADALHPTAAVGGTPTGEAVALIAELEGMDRGRYAGPVGWMDARGDGEVAIALRCAELSGARARLFAGAGIVAGSLPEAELEETRLKLEAMMGALGAA